MRAPVYQEARKFINKAAARPKFERSYQIFVGCRKNLYAFLIFFMVSL
jgi:hypothetical protein